MKPLGLVCRVPCQCCLRLAAGASASSQVVRFGKLWDGTKIVNDAVVTIEGNRYRLDRHRQFARCRRAPPSRTCANTPGFPG